MQICLKSSDGNVLRVRIQTFITRQREPVDPAADGWTVLRERSGNIAEAVSPLQHQHGCQPTGMVFITYYAMGSFLHQASFVTGYVAVIGIAHFGWWFWLVWQLIRSHNPDWIPSKRSNILRSYLALNIKVSSWMSILAAEFLGQKTSLNFAENTNDLFIGKCLFMKDAIIFLRNIWQNRIANFFGKKNWLQKLPPRNGKIF